MDSNKNNDRLKRVQEGRENEIPLEKNGLWFLVIYKNGNWDAENNLDVFLEDIKNDKINLVFCCWHGEWRTNLFLMSKEFIKNYFKDKYNKGRYISKKNKKT